MIAPPLPVYVTSPNQLKSQDIEDLKDFCKDHNIVASPNKTEIIARALDFFPDLKAPDLYNFTYQELYKMCTVRHIPVNKRLTKTTLILRLLENVEDYQELKKRYEILEQIEENKLTYYPISPSKFLERAKPLRVEINDQEYIIDPKVFEYGACGWHGDSKQKIYVGGKELTIAWTLNMTITNKSDDNVIEEYEVVPKKKEYMIREVEEVIEEVDR